MQQVDTTQKPQPNNATMKRVLLVLNIILLSIGNCGGPLLIRLYFLHGGKRVWFSGWLEAGGWPILFIPLFISYLRRRSTEKKAKLFYMKPLLFIYSMVIGVFVGLDNYLYAYGLARLPVSTSSLIIATQLAFTAGFAFLLVKQKFTPFSTNAIVLLTVGAGILAMHSGSDRPANESNKDYILGFFLTLVAAALYGLILPLVELTYMKAKQEVTYVLVMEIQMVMCFSATIFCTIGMLINNDFKAISREAREFSIGETKYYVTIVCGAILWQCLFLGIIGVIFYGSSLLSGVLITVLLPVTEILAVIFFKEKFQSEKGVALALSLWGFISYFYGEIKGSKRDNLALETVIPQSSPVENYQSSTILTENV